MQVIDNMASLPLCSYFITQFTLLPLTFSILILLPCPFPSFSSGRLYPDTDTSTGETKDLSAPLLIGMSLVI